MSKLIRLADVVDDKIRKEKELEFYEKELRKLHQRMAVLSQEINVTNIIIDLVKHENVRDFKKNLKIKIEMSNFSNTDNLSRKTELLCV